MAEDLGSAVLELRTDGSDIEKGIEQTRRTAAQSLDRAGQQLKSTGTTLTRNVTLPLLAAGAGIAKMGADFESELSRIVGLVGISQDKVDAFASQILELGPKIGKSPRELAEALFTVTSAGLRGAEAMEVLEQAGKASAAGLGQTRDIAEAVTGAINAYGPEVLSAARATEILVATARAGNFATDELAGSLGRVTPFAEAAGASMEDVGGAIATLTRINNDARQSVTQTAALMRAFAAPATQTQKALDELRLSTDAVRKSMSEEGLVGTLQMLDKRLGGNRDKLREIIPDSQGFSAALQILNADASVLDGTFGAVANSTGIVDEAFQAAEGTTRQDFNKAMSELAGTAIELFTTLKGPLSDGLRTLTRVVSRAAEAWKGLSPEMQANIVKGVALIAVLGPLLVAIGAVVSAIGTIIGVLGPLAVALTGPIGILALLVTGLIAAYQTSERFRNIVNRAFLFVKLAVINAVRSIVSKFLWFADMLISTAAAAFSWIPGLGPKLERARATVKVFREKANAELARIQRDVEIEIRANSSDFVSEANRILNLKSLLSAGVTSVFRLDVAHNQLGLGFKHGGVVTASSGMRLPGMERDARLIKAHVGETVTPAGQQDGSGDTFADTYQFFGVREGEIVRELRRRDRINAVRRS